MRRTNPDLTIVSFVCVLAIAPTDGVSQQPTPPQVTRSCYQCDRLVGGAIPCGCTPGTGCIAFGQSIHRVACFSGRAGGSEWCDELSGPIGWRAPCVPSAIDNWQLWACMGLTALCGFPCAPCIAAPNPLTCGGCIGCLAAVLTTSCSDPCTYYSQGCLADPTRITVIEGLGYACETGPLCAPSFTPDSG